MSVRGYCQSCYAPLDRATGPKCPKCGRMFKPDDPRTFLRRPFPRAGLIVAQVIGTTAVACGVAYFVAFFQMARTSGH